MAPEHTSATAVMHAHPNGRRMIRAMCAAFALGGFCVAIAAGLASGNSASVVLGRALLALIGCYVVGAIASLVCAHVLAQFSGQLHDRQPVPALDAIQPGVENNSADVAGDAEPDEEVVVV